jgi:hypothetical protein
MAILLLLIINQATKLDIARYAIAVCVKEKKESLLQWPGNGPGTQKNQRVKNVTLKQNIKINSLFFI